ncbi:hypothetical protein [Psychroserpens luteolus]|uniref:hypothetical protein n=1 Tax=Psychroserpens luteolus TaxID=2855840 RepID=UPI001E420C92|nr:hypothetical protein [Psychroserpens luteolus]MCD2257590.1 hypothetical protein [Psychroserpens luteolus]
MKNIVYLLLAIVFLSCKNEKQYITFQQWHNSIESAINNSDIEEFQKENLLISISEISNQDFKKLNELIETEKRVEKEYYVLEVSDGEVSSTTLNCIKETKDETFLSKVIISIGERNFDKRIVSVENKFSDMIKMTKDNKYNYDLLITSNNDGEIISFFKNANDSILDLITSTVY